MSVVIVKNKITKEDIKTAREEHDTYIKITADIEQKEIAIGGQLHADAEKLLVIKFNSKNKYIWGGGYSISRKVFTTDAILNIKPYYQNDSTEILDPEAREAFLKLAKQTLKEIESLL